MFRAYKAVFKRVGVKFVIVQADTGLMGGKKSEEFHIPARHGEDVLLVSDSGDFAANREICPVFQGQMKTPLENPKPKEEIATPGVKTIEDLSRFLNCKSDELVKILFVKLKLKKESSDLVAFLCQGDDEMNLLKAAKVFKDSEGLILATPEEIKKLTGADPGSCGPVNLNCPVYADYRLKGKVNFITGANKTGFHFKNVNFRDFRVTGWGDFCYAKAGDLSPQGKGVLKEFRGIEVGHLFYLSDTYSRSMDLKYSDKGGRSRYVEMGCYGLGITRTLQAVVEQSHDEKGIIWPLSIAPCAVHICLIDPKDLEVLQTLLEVEKTLKTCHLDYFIDDREERPGVKFKDADLLGMPFRLNIGKKDIKNFKSLEFVTRKTGFKEKIPLKDLKKNILKVLKCQGLSGL